MKLFFGKDKKEKTMIDLNLKVVGLGDVSLDLDFEDVSVGWNDECKHCTKV